MQADMYYYGTYAMARSAGLSAEVARTIAYASQFVNDYTSATRVQFDDGAFLDVGPTAYAALDYKTLLLEKQCMTWLPFNFLPGNQGATTDERLICKMDSQLGRDLVTHHIKEIHRSCYLHLVGIAAHVYASTFSHYDFSGVFSQLNAIDADSIAFKDLDSEASDRFGYINRKFKTFQKKFTMGTAVPPPIGHGDAATLPDRPYLNWSFKYQTGGQRVERNNPQTFLQACKGLHAMFLQVGKTQPKLARGDPRKFEEIQQAIIGILAVKADIKGRISAWQESARAAILFADPAQGIPPYDKNEWNQFLKRLTGSMDSQAVFDMDPVQFCEAAALHRGFVLNELLPRNGLDLKSIFPESETPLDFSQDYVSRPSGQAALLVPGVTADDPFAHALDESSSIDREAKAFAALAASKSLTPPLSVGVFGRWGAGKSFFMARMQQFVKELSKPGGKGQWFHSHIVQIRFNAWHYMETNLWASLVEKIFTELDRWLIANWPKGTSEDRLGRLITARTQELKATRELAAKRRNLKEASDAYEEVHREHQRTSEAIARLSPSATARAIWTTLIQSLPTGIDRERLQDAFKILGYSDLQERGTELQTLSVELGSSAGRMRRGYGHVC